jgi:hypothetical protein
VFDKYPPSTATRQSLVDRSTVLYDCSFYWKKTVHILMSPAEERHNDALRFCNLVSIQEKI